MGFFVLVGVLLAVDVVATVVCILKGRHVAAFFGVVAVGNLIWFFISVATFVPMSGYWEIPAGVIGLLVSLPLSLIVIIGAPRQAKTWSYWGTRQQNSWIAKGGNHLEGDEQVLITVEGYRVTTEALRSGRSGVLIATDRRLLFYTKTMTGFELESIPYKTISSFEHDTLESGDDTLKFDLSGSIVLIVIHAENLDEFVAVVKSKMGEA